MLRRRHALFHVVAALIPQMSRQPMCATLSKPRVAKRQYVSRCASSVNAGPLHPGSVELSCVVVLARQHRVLRPAPPAQLPSEQPARLPLHCPSAPGACRSVHTHRQHNSRRHTNGPRVRSPHSPDHARVTKFNHSFVQNLSCHSRRSTQTRRSAGAPLAPGLQSVAHNDATPFV